MTSTFTEATRVQLTALLHLTRIGYTYMGKPHLNPELVHDEATNIILPIFEQQFKKLNPKALVSAQSILADIRKELDDDDLGKQFYRRLIAISPIKLIDFEHPENNVFHCTAEMPCVNGNESRQQLADDSMGSNRQQFADDFPETNEQPAGNNLEVAVNAKIPQEIFLIPWGHNILILDKCKGNRDKALFYVHKTLENSWSRAVLLNFLDTDLFERQGKAITNFAHPLPEPLSDLAQQITKDPYTFDYLTLTERYEEKELKQALIGNIERFLMELGKGFAYMGREYRLEVGDEERFIDMLFYHTGLHCYVVIEVKVQKFDPADLGQLGFYVSAVNHILKKMAIIRRLACLCAKPKTMSLRSTLWKGQTCPLASQNMN